MSERRHDRKLWKLLPAALPVVLAGWLLAAAGSLPQQAPTDELIGSETCLACHEIHPAFQRTAHAAIECEDCHGPGGLHLETGGENRSIGFANRPASRYADACLKCHGQQQTLALFRTSEHGRGGIACGACHQLHPTEPGFGLMAGRQLDLCSGCHPAARSAFLKPFHHPVPEGNMECSDCHNPHAGDQPPLRRLVLATEENCAGCHADKNGPFVFEHAPLEITSCQSCHEPHGAINPRMLRRTDVAQLCLECHSRTAGLAASQPFSFHDLRSPRFRNCTTCHREIHGSNVSPNFLR